MRLRELEIIDMTHDEDALQAAAPFVAAEPSHAARARKGSFASDVLRGLRSALAVEGT